MDVLVVLDDEIVQLLHMQVAQPHHLPQKTIQLLQIFHRLLGDLTDEVALGQKRRGGFVEGHSVHGPQFIELAGRRCISVLRGGSLFLPFLHDTAQGGGRERLWCPLIDVCAILDCVLRLLLRFGR